MTERASKFLEGAHIALKGDRLELGLKAGDQGIVWTIYAGDKPSYEVSFRGADESEIDLTME